jgi:hypothetical protein
MVQIRAIFHKANLFDIGINPHAAGLRYQVKIPILITRLKAQDKHGDREFPTDNGTNPHIVYAALAVKGII